MRVVLKDNLESRAACEWILECLWTVAKVCLSLSFTLSRADLLSLSALAGEGRRGRSATVRARGANHRTQEEGTRRRCCPGGIEISWEGKSSRVFGLHSYVLFAVVACKGDWCAPINCLSGDARAIGRAAPNVRVLSPREAPASGSSSAGRVR